MLLMKAQTMHMHIRARGAFLIFRVLSSIAAYFIFANDKRHVIACGGCVDKATKS